MDGYLICEGYGEEQTTYAAYSSADEVIEETKEYIEFHKILLIDYVDKDLLNPQTLEDCARFWQAQGGFVVEYKNILDEDIDL